MQKLIVILLSIIIGIVLVFFYIQEVQKTSQVDNIRQYCEGKLQNTKFVDLTLKEIEWLTPSILTQCYHEHGISE